MCTFTQSEAVVKNIYALVLMNCPSDKGVHNCIPVHIMGA